MRIITNENHTCENVSFRHGKELFSILDWAIVCSSHWRWPFEKTFAFVLSYDVLWTFFFNGLVTWKTQKRGRLLLKVDLSLGPRPGSFGLTVFNYWFLLEAAPMWIQFQKKKKKKKITNAFRLLSFYIFFIKSNSSDRWKCKEKKPKNFCILVFFFSLFKFSL